MVVTGRGGGEDTMHRAPNPASVTLSKPAKKGLNLQLLPGLA